MPTVNGRNRGYYKIKGASDAFDFDFRGKTVLDIGSSTGGFTKYALDHGAAKVIAVEKGTNQMMSPLRDDPRVELHEKTDIFDVIAQTSTSEGISERGSARDSALAPWRRARATRPDEVLVCAPDIILADVSFISLTRVLSYAKSHLSSPHSEYLVMLKPQFEARPDQLSNGIVKNDRIRREIIKNFEQWLKRNGFIIKNKHDNELTGKHGNLERFYYLAQSNS